MHTSFSSLKQVEAGVLNIGYADAGPADGTAVVLLHGWPYDIYSYVDVAPVLASAGHRVIIPYLRGYGSTTFLSPAAFRNGQQAAVAVDISALMDALEVDRAIIGGFDWGSRTACVMAALWPERCKALVSVSGYLITSLEGNRLAPATAGFRCRCTSLRAGALHRQRHSTGAFPADVAYGRKCLLPRTTRTKRETKCV